MPIYEYECRKCGQQWEVVQIRQGENFPPCPKCGEGNPKQVVSTPAVVYEIGGRKT
jgi:putative FmdB family regulatory protein